MADERIDPSALPSGAGGVECLAADGWWLHLRRCARCGHIGCCDTSPSQHASRHAAEIGHTVIRSFEPGEEWFWDFESSDFCDGPTLAGAKCHPISQPVPGPEGRVPPDWERHLHY
ncbi:MAG TPA: UBP-type zinc finger domain-containing protein [Acidimicrobiales bacterium]|nr:UBP-type zinc finger domain-containing protein [Acidimicrobiales bacterium]